MQPKSASWLPRFLAKQSQASNHRKWADLPLATKGKVLDIALESGFGNLGRFNEAFKTEFGVTPKAFRSREPEWFPVATKKELGS